MLAEMRERGERARGGESIRPKPELRPATLADFGISKTQSGRWQGLADMPDEKFEQRVGRVPASPLSHGSH